MPVDVTMPKLTDSMEEGRLVEWKVAPGDRVREGDVLAEIETDKAVMELESFWNGVVAELARSEGDVVAVGEVIARIAEPGEEAAARGVEAETPKSAAAEETAGRTAAGAGDTGSREEPEAERGEEGADGSPGEDRASPAGLEEAGHGGARVGEEPGQIPLPGAHPLAERGGVQSPRPEPPPRRAGGESGDGLPKGPAPGVRASPRARKLARETGVDLSEVTGSGPEGRITTADVQAAAPRRGTPEDRDTRRASEGPPQGDLPAVSFAKGEAEVEEISFFQKAAIRRIAASARTVPHFYVSAAVRAEGLLARKEAEGPGVTLTHLLLRASALTLEAFPEANRSYDRGRWIRWNVVNLGVAVQVEAGLVVAVLRGAQGKDLAWVAERTQGLVERARAGRLKPEERTNATFTFSNLGSHGVESFAAIINPPSALTLAAGAVAEAPVVRGGRVEAGRVMHLTLSCDHRVVDGVLAARFLGALKGHLEEPGVL